MKSALSYARYFVNPVRAVRRLQWRNIHHGRPRHVTIDTYNGRLTVDSRDNVIGKELYCFRHWERELLQAVPALLRAEGLAKLDGTGTLLDIGANIGMISTAALLHGLAADALAFEPAPDNFALLEQNVRQNGLDARVHRRPWALSSAPGTLQLELSEMNFGDHRIRHTSGGGAFSEDSRRVIEVPVHTLDGALRDDPALAALRPEVVWIDIQGHEGHFFRGAAQTLARGVPVVSEFWPYGVLRSGMSRDEYLGILESTFTDVFVRTEGRYVRSSIGTIAGQFDALASSTGYTEVIFARA